MKPEMEMNRVHLNPGDMSTKALDDLVAQDFSNDQNTFLTTEDILAILETIDDREHDSPEVDWVTFRARIDIDRK